MGGEGREKRREKKIKKNFCVGKMKPKVLSGQVNAGHLKQGREERQEVCVSFWGWK